MTSMIASPFHIYCCPGPNGGGANPRPWSMYGNGNVPPTNISTIFAPVEPVLS